MNTFPISKSFTAVVVLLVALSGWGAEKDAASGPAAKEESRESCEIAAKAKFSSNCDNVVGDEAQLACMSKKGLLIQNACSYLEPKSSQKAECTSLISDYKKVNEKIKNQCARAKQGNTEKCKQLAASCGQTLDVGGMEDNGEETPEQSEKILESIYGIFSSGKEKQSADSCTIEDDEDKEATNTERINEKIGKLRADISTLKEDAAKADDDVAKKKQEVEEKILEIEKEMDKKTTERKTEAQKETVKMQEAALDAIKRKKAALKSIEDKNRNIAFLRIQQQEEAIKFTQSNLMKACRDQALEIKAKMIADATKAAATSNQSMAVTGNIKRDVRFAGAPACRKKLWASSFPTTTRPSRSSRILV